MDRSHLKQFLAVCLLGAFLCSAAACSAPAPSSSAAAGSSESAVQETEPPASSQVKEPSAEEIAAFFQSFQQAVLADERETVAELFRFPKEPVLPGQEKQYIHSAEEFLPVYDQIFTEEFIAQIQQLDPADFASDPVSGISWGEGLIWAKEYDGSLQMISVFPSRADRYLAYYEGNDAA